MVEFHPGEATMGDTAIKIADMFHRAAQKALLEIRGERAANNPELHVSTIRFLAELALYRAMQDPGIAHLKLAQQTIHLSELMSVPDGKSETVLADSEKLWRAVLTCGGVMNNALLALKKIEGKKGLYRRHHEKADEALGYLVGMGITALEDIERAKGSAA